MRKIPVMHMRTDESNAGTKSKVTGFSVLKKLDILDTSPCESFDRITRIASQIFDLPIAAVSLSDVDRQWFKSRVGVQHESIPRYLAPCAQVSDSANILVIKDMAADTRYCKSHLGQSGIRFYAGAPLVTKEGFGLGALCVLGTEPRDVTEREIRALTDLADMVMAQIELQHAYGRIDPVSGLPNRKQFYDDIVDLAKDEHNLAVRLVVLIDLAGTSQIDDLARVIGPGHLDACVKAAACLLKEEVGRHRTIYNVSNTQFTFLAAHGSREEDTLAELAHLLSRLQEVTDLHFLLAPVAGIFPFTPGCIEAAELLKALNSAAQDARQGNSQVGLFSLELDEKHRRHFRISQDLKAALCSKNQLSLVFQPRIDLTSGRCIAVEVLLRWQHPELGTISPGEFIPIIERSLGIRDLTFWVLNAALKQVRSWIDSGLSLPVSVNVSAANIDDGAFAEHVVAALMRHGVPPTHLELEVTESAIMKNTQTAVRTLESLRDAGVALSIDDFGTGYSSLSYLQKLPTKVLKIDQSFIRDLESDERGQCLVQSMITLSHDLGYRVVAEGIETAAVRKVLTRMSCDEGQGYLFAKPLAAPALEAWLKCDLRRTRTAA
ncbi:EAL domain-containing protein (putative c-di-GMP-specific phosphodiesterase class I) [Rhizobium sp. PP-F2F-G48]|uniref:sensor domain-containing phosphodiesterase n=1 Tax=Rhizobium sp. PP-F2F-G48 TaxID=2135651 RepID=UPI0010D334DC|nr:sensor domain-containing phosphodiesterase [Rhizobium sp. PP-F2F-G48]TCM48417.1 EAL domain-containing protein (putative c-di-GMP-specific phosphodiesterase class I) [Rhizobium sp. PP-F2F-G48]